MIINNSISFTIKDNKFIFRTLDVNDVSENYIEQLKKIQIYYILILKKSVS